MASTSFRLALSPSLKEPHSAPQNERIDQEIVFINELVLHQRLYKLAAAMDQDILAGLLLQSTDLFRDILFYQL